MHVSTCEYVSTKVTYAFLTCTYSNKNLSAAMHNLNVLVLHEAAHDSDVGVALRGADPCSLWHLSPHTAWSMFAPPGVMG